MIVASKDTIVPFEEVCFFLVKEMEFGDKETVEMAEHEGRGGLSGGGKISPIEVGLDGAVAVRGTDVRCKGVEVCTRQC